MVGGFLAFLSLFFSFYSARGARLGVGGLMRYHGGQTEGECSTRWSFEKKRIHTHCALS